MSFYTNTAASFATTAAPAFHAISTTKRGCDAVLMEDDEACFQYERSHKRIKISSSTGPSTALFGASSYHQPHQSSAFPAPIQFTSPCSGGSTCFTYGGESQTKKRGRNAC